MIGKIKSVSKLLSLFCNTDAKRSKPAPVSMFFLANGSYVPSAVRLNCVNTRFQISRKRSQSQPGAQFGSSQPRSGPKSKKISLSGPHGPSPISQKLSSKRLMWFSGKPISLCQVSYASWSSGYTVTYNFSLSNLMTSVKNSHAQWMASFLK